MQTNVIHFYHCCRSFTSVENFADTIGLLKILLTTLQKSYMFEGKKASKQDIY